MADLSEGAVRIGMVWGERGVYSRHEQKCEVKQRGW